MSKPRLIAFYLPQFYPTKENDEWWQKGFTEWTNVGNAKPLFKGHYQPRVPADLGYYDLRVTDVREEQVQLAREAGIEGFCYWHYWFAGRRLLDRVFSEVVNSGKPDYPFCLCWANHSWYRKTWDPSKPDRLLIEQTYPGIKDFVEQFYEMLPAFKDKRYINVNGKLLYGFYDAISIKEDVFRLMKDTWNRLALENGLSGFSFFGYTFRPQMQNSIKEKGFDYVVCDYSLMLHQNSDILMRIKKKWLRLIKRPDKLYKYDDYVNVFLNSFSVESGALPCLIPNFDHSPRSGGQGLILHKSTPSKWGILCRKIFEICSKKDANENIVFIKAWNEWGEGNYMEPDMKYGKGYILETRKSLEAVLH